METQNVSAKLQENSIQEGPLLSKTAAEKERKTRAKASIAIEHVDIIKDEFWELRPWILSGTVGRLKNGTTPNSSQSAGAVG